MVAGITGKRLGLLRELVPSTHAIGLLADPHSSQGDIEADARAMGISRYTAYAGSEEALDGAFASFGAHRIGAVVAGTGSAFTNWRKRIVALAANASLPAIYALRQSVTDDGLMSYGPALGDAYRQAVAYVAEILKGARPADLPVVQSSKFEMAINLRTARALGLEVPVNLLALADEIIE